MEKKIDVINKVLFFMELYKLSWLAVTLILIINDVALDNKFYITIYMPVWLILACWTPAKTCGILVFLAYLIVSVGSIIFTIEKICLNRFCRFEVAEKIGFTMNIFWLVSIVVTVLYWIVSLVGML